MRRFSAIPVLTIACLWLLVLFPSHASAIGIGIGPSSLEISSALRGAEYERTFTIFNPDEAEAHATLGTDGEAGAWISLHQPDDLSRTIEGVTIPGKGRASIVAKFRIPSDAPNGTYTVMLYAEITATSSASIESGESGAVAKVRAPAEIKIEVTGTEVISGEVGDILADEVEINYPLRLRVQFWNTGNVIAKPVIDVDVLRDGAPVAHFTSADLQVKASARDILIAAWDTEGMQVGMYTAHVTVSLEGEVLGSKDVAFEILPVGTLSRRGSLETLSYSGNPVLEQLVKIEARFANTGEIDSTAKSICEVYCNGELVTMVESEAINVPPRGEEVLVSYLKIERKGNYVVRGQVVFDGKRTEVKEISLEVEAGAEEAGGGGAGFQWPLIGGVAGLVLVLTGTVVVLRRNGLAKYWRKER